MASKFYAVRKGRSTGIFNTWSECQEQIKGYSGAVYKSFSNEEDALAYMNESKQPKYADEMSLSKAQFIELSKKHPDTMFAFVDGSCIGSERYGAGAISFYRGQVTEYSEEGTNEKIKSMRNVAGELMAAMYAIDLAIYSGASEAVLFYDYAGIEEWATGSWAASKEGTKEYVQYIKDVSPLIKISFCKVSGHTGVPMNEEADRLARMSLGL